MRRIAPLLALLTLSPPLPACQTCTLVGCGPAVQIIVGNEDGPIDPMARTVEVELDLDGDRFVVTSVRSEPGCEVERDGFNFNVEGLFLPDHVEIEIYGRDELAPDLIEVYVLVDDDQAFEGSLSPEYTDREINGEGCGVCRSAEDDPFSLPAS